MAASENPQDVLSILQGNSPDDGRIASLLDKGADPNACDSNGNSALHWAAWTACLPALTVLLEGGADIHSRNNHGENPIHWAARSRSPGSVAALLYAPGATPLATDNNGRTPLHTCAQGGMVGSMSLLVMAGGDVNCIDSNSRTPLHWAVHHSHKTMVMWLLSNGANVELQDDTGKMPMHWAIAKGNFQILEVFLASGGRYSLLKTDAEGNNALDMASKLDNPRIKAVLNLELGCTPNCFKECKEHPLPRYLPEQYATWASTLYLRHFQTSCVVMIIHALFFNDLNISNVLFALLCVISLSLSVVLHRSAPGYLPLSLQPFRTRIFTLFGDGVPSNTRYCTTCRSLKPMRSKHCSKCNRCVSCFDHHCPFINNCVGRDNYHLFIVHITIAAAGIVYATYYAWVVPHTIWTLLMFLHNLLLSIWICGLTIFHFYLISMNLTSNEMSQWHRMDYLYNNGIFNNPFDLGIVGNVLQFLSQAPRPTLLVEEMQSVLTTTSCHDDNAEMEQLPLSLLQNIDASI